MAERSARGTAGGAAATELGTELGRSSTAMGSTGMAGSSAGGAGDALRQGTDQVVDEAKAMVREMADTQRMRAAERLGGMAQALHRTAGNLGTENKQMARYTEIAAERLDDVSRYLRQTNWGDLLEGAENMARRQPYWFIGGAMAAGFLVARFLKSSPQPYMPPGGTQYGTTAGTAYTQPTTGTPYGAGAGELQ